MYEYTFISIPIVISIYKLCFKFVKLKKKYLNINNFNIVIIYYL